MQTFFFSFPQWDYWVGGWVSGWGQHVRIIVKQTQASWSSHQYPNTHPFDYIAKKWRADEGRRLLAISFLSFQSKLSIIFRSVFASSHISGSSECGLCCCCCSKTKLQHCRVCTGRDREDSNQGWEFASALGGACFWRFGEENVLF